ncbi:MAG TPA: vitamin B12-dependent ribonucleotide reductase [Nakamurella sp.]|nr:vitamin B12-dependent ribonucleotide reductase [Nakamurella sp.]
MTETVGSASPAGSNGTSSAGSRRKQSGRAGLSLKRLYSTEGVHPYDEVTWERRDVVMTNWRDGSINFEQRGVEFPDFWSVNATNIVTSKYFRGAVGTPQRESSLRQIIDRVVTAYTTAGTENGYFATEDDAQVFADELTWMLLHQVFSFNSPVWFNVGTASPQQVSACQPYDALVSTPAGLVPIGKLVADSAVGTKVYDAHGLTTVLATKHNGRKEVLRIFTKAGHALDVTADHLVWRSTGQFTGQFVPAAELAVGDTLEWHRRTAFGEQEIRSQDIAEAAREGTTAIERGSVPESMFTAPLPVVAAYLRSIFQAEGFVSARPRSTLVGMAMICEELVRGVQALLSRFGIFARVGHKTDKRPDRHDMWEIRIQNEGDRRIFADEIGFIDPVKAAKLEASFQLAGRGAPDVKRLQIARIESRGVMDVYDIQTESGEYLSAGGLRVHNCFILAVDDTMDSILNWYREEGLIFKGGSGAGLNLSRIRSSKELLSSGGTASGPVSFMRGADASAGTIKSGGATRRAAKMVVLDVDHPDIEEFVETKAKEENKIRVLRDAGFDMDLGGADIVSVQYQTANNSVRVSDEFMRAVEDDGEHHLRARLDGSVIETIDAKALFDKITTAAWECADPGIQYDDTINDWHTCPESGRINASNPCSEYMHLDNSSCNLASLNLMKFLSDDGTFDTEKFARAVEFVITAMDISICFADFPTEKIGETTRAFRQLGIGYANLGALLMATAHAYDSEGGRTLAAAITSLMQATAYRRSAELAAVVGPYDGYARNADAHTRVIRKHAAANDAVRPVGGDDADILKVASKVWLETIALGEKNGYRNAQASVLAPTGTIGLMMDCDTTGVEPDLALVKFKKLVGGGSMQIVNQTVPRALRSLGYQPEQVEAIVEYIAEHGHVVDAPGLRPEHYEVFDCAMGERSIAPMGHVRMMAAIQPFISGAISKTVNMPESATVEDVAEIYTQGWKLGLKALAIYRDNCKVGQPLSAKKQNADKAGASAPAVVPATAEPGRPVRRRLPKKRPSQTVSFTVGGAEGYLTTGSYPDDGLGEVFIKLGKQGSTLAGVMDAFSIAVSVGLQYGIPLETYVSKFTNLRFEPAGMTDDPDVRIATSVMDYLFRRIALDYLPVERRAELGIFSAAERTAQVAAQAGGAVDDSDDGDEEDVAERIEELRTSVDATPQPTPAAEREANERGVRSTGTAGSSTELLEMVIGKSADAPLCMTCGTKMRPSGACYVCEGCGSTSGCS